MLRPKVINHKGTTLVEFALVLPLFLIFIFAILDFGWYFFVTHTLEFATREGTRLALVGGTLNDEHGNPMSRVASIIKKIQDNAKLAVKNPANLNIYIFPVLPDNGYADPTGWETNYNNENASAGSSGDYMRVRTRYSYQSLTPIGQLLSGVHLQGKTIEAQTLYKNELF
jgi:hypothetical protein